MTYNLLLNRFALERLLCRVAASPHADRFLLKGALLFSLWYDQPHRPTRDADAPVRRGDYGMTGNRVASSRARLTQPL